MPNAWTLETMSPGLLKVGETRSPEPHRRKSRMREIRLSGSGEGLGWATSQPTLQRHVRAAPPERAQPGGEQCSTPFTGAGQAVQDGIGHQGVPWGNGLGTIGGAGT